VLWIEGRRHAGQRPVKDTALNNRLGVLGDMRPLILLQGQLGLTELTLR